jgi:class 3 adenylate cyclase/pimeloyl-ACP methyl ester carboxylesterase
VATGTRTRYATSDGGDIAYQVLGDGPVDILLYSGSMVSIDCMDDEPSLARFQRRLASFSRVIRFDRRGVGLSDRGSPSKPPTYEDWARDGLAVLDEVGSERAAVFAPFTSSAEAVVLGVTEVERISHVVVVNGASRARWAPDYPMGVPQSVVDLALEITVASDALEQGYDNLRMFAPSMADDPAFRGWWDRAGNVGATPAMARALLAGVFDVDVRHLLPEVKVPTLIIHGANLAVLPVEHGRYMAERIPGSKYLEVPGTDVFYWLGDTEAILDEIEEFLTGVRGSGTERVLATVLFTDIVGSTDRAAQLGDGRWRDLLDRHDKSVRAEIGRFRGREVNTMGDGFVASFESPGRAIECALAIRGTLKGFDIDVRAGIHTGEIELRGSDVAGLAVHIGARVAGLAGPGEVLVSGSVPPLVAGSGFEFTDRGEHELKGVPGTWQVLAVDRK